MAFSASQELQHAPELLEAMEFLGYPAYVLTMLGTAKLLGISRETLYQKLKQIEED